MKELLLLLLCFSFCGFSQVGEPRYKFKLADVEYSIFISQGSENKTYDTIYYNLYRVGKDKVIGKEIKSVTDHSTGEVIAESYYNVTVDKISFYYSANNKGIMERKYTQNKKGTLTFKSAEIKIPPPEQARVNFYNENHQEKVMVTIESISSPLDQVDEVAQFPGGINKLSQFLSANIVYPDDALENNVNGKVIVSFIVEIDGTISKIALYKKLGYGCDEEVIRVIKLSPKWIPAQLDGKPVRSNFNLPVEFVTID